MGRWSPQLVFLVFLILFYPCQAPEVPVKAMPPWPKDVDPVALQALQGMTGDTLRAALQEYSRAVSNRKPKAMPKAEPKKPAPVVDLVDPKGETQPPLLQHQRPQPQPEQKVEAAVPCAAPAKKGEETAAADLCPPAPAEAAAATPAAPSRPKRRPFPPPRGFRWGMTQLFFLNDFDPVQELRTHE